MQITTNRIEKITYEIQNGFYKRGEDTLALLDGKIIRITRFNEFVIIQLSNAESFFNSFDINEPKAITKEEFLEAYNEATTFINDRLGLTHYGL